MENTIKFSSGIKKIAITDENGNVATVILLDKNDNTLKSKYLDLLKRAEEIQKEHTRKLGEIDLDESMEIEDAVNAVKATDDALNELADEVEKLLGANVFHDMYSQNYEINPNFVPTIDAITEFLDQLIPIMEDLFGFDKPKYAASNRGKNTKTKQELIEEAKEAANAQ